MKDEPDQSMVLSFYVREGETKLFSQVRKFMELDKNLDNNLDFQEIVISYKYTLNLKQVSNNLPLLVLKTRVHRRFRNRYIVEHNVHAQVSVLTSLSG